MALTCRVRYKLETISAVKSTNGGEFGSLDINVEEDPTNAAICSVETVPLEGLCWVLLGNSSRMSLVVRVALFPSIRWVLNMVLNPTNRPSILARDIV